VPTNIRLGWKLLAMTNTLAYDTTVVVSAARNFMLYGSSLYLVKGKYNFIIKLSIDRDVEVKKPSCDQYY
jgi:hypothetical protein